MLEQSKVEEIRRLLVVGDFSQRHIARMTGVSRGSVGAIASGKRPDYEKSGKEQEEIDHPLGPLERCPTCGGKVYMPCRLCTLRRQLSKKKKSSPEPPPGPPPEGSLAIRLRRKHRRRYEKIQRMRMSGKPICLYAIEQYASVETELSTD